VVSALALAYSVWAVIGAGWDAVFWGGVLLALGTPIYLVGAGRRAVLPDLGAEVGDA
jgi:APA family basic amino acid/polyamine antiporter